MDRKNKVFVDVDVEFAPNGRMRPVLINWANGEKYEIMEIRDIRRAPARIAGGFGDRYTIVVRGHETLLFFEHSPDEAVYPQGRWFVESKAIEPTVRQP